MYQVSILARAVGSQPAKSCSISSSERRRTAGLELERRPGSGGPAADLLVRAFEAIQDLPGQRLPGLLRDLRPQPLEGVGEVVGRPQGEEALGLFLRGQEDAAEDEARNSVRVGLGVSQCERRAPGAAEEDHALDSEVPAQVLDILDEVLSCIFPELAERTAAAGSPLVVQNHAKAVRISPTAVLGAATGARAAVEDEQRLPTRVAGLLVIDLVDSTDAEVARMKGPDLREEIGAWHSLVRAVHL